MKACAAPRHSIKPNALCFSVCSSLTLCYSLGLLCITSSNLAKMSELVTKVTFLCSVSLGCAIWLLKKEADRNHMRAGTAIPFLYAFTLLPLCLQMNLKYTWCSLKQSTKINHVNFTYSHITSKQFSNWCPFGVEIWGRDFHSYTV